MSVSICVQVRVYVLSGGVLHVVSVGVTADDNVKRWSVPNEALLGGF